MLPVAKAGLPKGGKNKMIGGKKPPMAAPKKGKPKKK
jgi:hypothetical protein